MKRYKKLINKRKNIRSAFRSSSFWAIFGLILVLAAILAGTVVLWAQNQRSVDNTTIYRYDPAEEQWVKTVLEIVLPENPDGSRPTGHRTIEIHLDEDNPVKTILIEETLIIDESGGTGPLLEIKGHEPSGGGDGKINIGTLAFVEVDAEELEITADVVRVTLENVVAEDDELDLDLNIVNVVRIGRGAASTLLLGISRDSLLDKLGTTDEDLDLERRRRGVTRRETGLRVDRIRIIGPDSGTGFVEVLVVLQSSVFGKIEVDDVRIQDLILEQVSLDDSL